MSAGSSWTYVDDRRTHEIHVSLEPRRTLDLVVREQVFGGTGRAAEEYVERHVLTEPWEQKLHTLALETRLALLGNYHRSGPRGWTPVRLAQPRDRLDLAPLELEGGSDAVEFHHFTSEGQAAVSLLGVRQETREGPRSLLVRIDYTFPHVEGGNLRIVHAKLPPPLYRSALASQHLELAAKRYRKAPRDTKRLGEPKQWAAMRSALDNILARLVEAPESGVGLRDGAGRPLDIRAITLVAQAAKAAQGAASGARSYAIDFEMDPAPAPTEAKRPDVLIEEIPQDIAQALSEPRLVALHGRFVAPRVEEDLLRRGDRAIRLAMRTLRGQVRPDEQHLVSLLEASLLLRYSFAHRVPVDPEVLKRVQHARAYL